MSEPSYRAARAYLDEAKDVLRLATCELLALDRYTDAHTLVSLSSQISEMRAYYRPHAEREGPEEPLTEELNLGDRGPDDSDEAQEAQP